MASGRKGTGLAARVVRATLVVGAITLLATVALAVVGTSQMLANRTASKDAASLQLIQDSLFARLAQASVFAARVSRVVSKSATPGALEEQLKSEYAVAQDYIDGAVVVDAAMQPLARVPASSAPLPKSVRDAASAALRGTPGLSAGSGAPNIGSLWLSRTVVLASGEPRVLLVNLDATFMQKLVTDVARDGRQLYILEKGVVLIGQGSAGTDFSAARWIPTGPSSGRVTITAPNGEMLNGHYDDLQGVEGVSWRFMTLEPMMLAVQNTAEALWPAIVVLVCGGLVGVVVGVSVVRQVVVPLRELESTALNAASGAYVKPLATGRDDEIGQLATAFNAVSLRLNALHDLSQLLASSSQLDQVLDGILSAMGHIVGPGVAAIYLLDEGGRWLVPARARGADISLAPAIDSNGDAWLAHALDDADPVAFEPGGRLLADELPGLATDETGALAAPLVLAHEMLGVVVVLSSDQTEASEAELEMVRTFSAQAAVAVQNSRLFEIETESRRISEGLRAVAEQLVRPRALDEALADVETTVTELFGAIEARFAVVDRAVLGLPPAEDSDAEIEMLGASSRLLARAGAHRPVIVRPGDDRGADAMMDDAGAHELLVVPIGLEGDHGAVLTVGFGEDRVSRHDIELAGAVADETELALDNAYLYQQALRRANNLETILRISQTVGSPLDVNVVLNRVLDAVQKILSADAVALLTYDTRLRTIKTAMARGAVSPALVDRVFRPNDDVIGYVFASGSPMAFKHLHDGMEGVAGDAARHGLQSMLAVPLLARGRSIGVLTVFSSTAGAFTDEGMGMLQTFAAQAALALDTARLYSHEHEVASLLQHSIVPGALPSYGGLDAASVYEPAGGDVDIGGDYYDMFRGPDDTVWLAIADVCGKGVNAATKTSMIKYSVRALVAAGLAPGGIVSEVNRMLAGSSDASDIVTLWVGRVDRARHTITWAGGGHPPVFLRRGRDGTCVKLASGGPLLGALAGVAYADNTERIGLGDAVVLYTDGVTEARSGNTFFGEERVEQVVQGGGSASEMVDRLRLAVRKFAENNLRDDVAILAVRIVED